MIHRSLLVLGALLTMSVRLGAQSPTLDALKSYLAKPSSERGAMADQPFAKEPLSKADAQVAQSLLWEARKVDLKSERAEEVKAGKIVLGDKEMPFFVKTFGDKPASGRSLLISMHGGGGAPPQVNDGQWNNQKKLYEMAEGVYVAPRAPTNTWNLWHEGHIDPMFDRLIEDMIVFEDVDPNRVYLTGYSAGGDGVYQLAPRMADRLAAAAMMAGHPNEASPLGLRNLPFTIHMGADDGAYNRNKVAAEWGEKLKALHAADPRGYEHLVKLHAGRGHWMNREDAEALPWMAKFTRQTFPKKIVWRQDDIVGARFYWLAVPVEKAQAGQEIVATLDGQGIDIAAPKGLPVRVRLCDAMLDMDQPISLELNNGETESIKVTRTIAIMAQSLAERADPTMVFSAEVVIN